MFEEKMYCKHKNDKLPGVLFQDRAECGNKFILFWYEIVPILKYLSQNIQKKVAKLYKRVCINMFLG